jgi:acetyltransferase
VTRNGQTVTVRPIRPEDEPALVRFHETLSEQTVYLRYLQHLQLNQRIAHQRLARLCFIDYAREMALVAERLPAAGAEGPGDILAVGRLARTGAGEAEFALLVADAHQGQGLGTLLLGQLVQIGRAEAITRIFGEISPINAPMQAICRRLGFKLERELEDPTVRAVLQLA